MVGQQAGLVLVLVALAIPLSAAETDSAPRGGLIEEGFWEMPPWLL